MSSIAISGNDTIILNDRSYVDLADGDAGKLEFGGVLVNQKNGKNGNAVFALNASGNAGKMTLRLILGSADDKNLNSVLANQNANFAGTILLKGKFTKQVGDSNGVITKVNYILSQGAVEKIPMATTNSEGSTDQSIAVWEIIFAYVKRAIA